MAMRLSAIREFFAPAREFYPVTEASTSASYEVFIDNLKEHYDSERRPLVEIALETLRNREGWNQRVREVNGLISPEDKKEVEKEVQRLQWAYPLSNSIKENSTAYCVGYTIFILALSCFIATLTYKGKSNDF